MYQQQNIGTQGYNQATHVSLQDGDLANVVLNELKRVAREYTTASLEASNPDIRQLFEQLLQQTLHDQGHLYQIISQLNLYGQPSSAAQNELHKEVNHHQQQLSGLQSFLQQWQGANRGGQASYRQNVNTPQQQAQQNQQHLNQQFQQYQQQQNALQQQQDSLQQYNQQNNHNLQLQQSLQQHQHNLRQQQYHQQQQPEQSERSMQSHQPMNVYGAQSNTHQHHHSSVVSDDTRETGSEPANNHTTGPSLTQ